MMSNNLYLDRQQLPTSFSLSDVLSRPTESAVLMCRPEHFCVASAINPHMLTESGQLQVVDEARAEQQWCELHDVLSDLGLRIEQIKPILGLPDMVFAANQSFPFLSVHGERLVLLSQMRRRERSAEVEYFRAWYEGRGYRAVDFPMTEAESLEGMGDLLWLGSRRLLFAGIGPRTAASVVTRLPDVLTAPVIGLELIDPKFYHLDTALAIIDESTALAHPAAFSPQSYQLLEAVFERVLVPPEVECVTGFACNALGLPSGEVILDELCVETTRMLENLGYTVKTLNTSEFRKSGGSVFCMKMMLPEAK